MTNELARRCYERGRETGKDNDCVTIALNRTWSASRADCSTTSYEKIGYHAGSLEFLKGVFSVGTPVYVYTQDANGLRKTRAFDFYSVKNLLGL